MRSIEGITKAKRIITLTLLAFTGMHYQSTACKCMPPTTVKDALERSEVVFNGKVLTKEPYTVNDTTLPATYKLQRMKITFLKSRVYKGKPLTDTITVTTGMGGGDCGYDFEVDANYIVYATYSDDATKTISTNSCTATKKTNKKELRQLKKATR